MRRVQEMLVVQASGRRLVLLEDVQGYLDTVLTPFPFNAGNGGRDTMQSDPGDWKATRWRSFSRIKNWATRQGHVYRLEHKTLIVSSADGSNWRYKEGPSCVFYFAPRTPEPEATEKP